MTVDTLGPDISPTLAELENVATLTKTYSLRELHLNKEQELFIKEKLSKKSWRLNNLYTIRTKDNIKKIMKLNKAQQIVLFNFNHNKKIILKSRQQGISTLFLAYYLDSCLFKSGFQAGIQSYGLDESIKLQKRVMLMWEELSQDVKDILGITLVSSNARGMTFSNGSVLKIGNFRGDTLQGLHVSELAKIAKNFPAKADELKTGAFQAVSIDSKITIESTAEGQEGMFYDMWVKAERRAALGKLTSLDFQPIFLPWTIDPDCQLEEGFEPEAWMIEELDKLYEIDPELKLTQLQLNWYFAKLYELEDKFNQEYPLTPELAFAQSIEGTYFKKQYDRLIKEKRLGDYTYNPELPVDLAFDLGLNDEMVITFGQINKGVPTIINSYENTGEGIEFYTDILNKLAEEKGYRYGRIYLPHDANVKELGTGITRVERFRQLGYRNLTLLKKLPFMDSINGARALIDRVCINDHDALDIAVSIQQYKKKYDKKLNAYLDKDVHDIHSNRMASFRYLAQGWGYRKFTTNTYKEPKITVASPLDKFRNKKRASKDYAIY